MSNCPRCTRILPPQPLKVCVYCGERLAGQAAPAGSKPPPPPLTASVTGNRLSRDPLIGCTIANRFVVEELIGQGGMGKVYKAKHLALDKSICLKMLKPALLEDPTLVGRFEREAKAASRLNNPNVIAVLDFGRVEREGTLYIAMEYVQGKDLRLVLRDEWPLPERRLCNIMAQVCSALGEAHSHAVIHRDLKPENIMIEQRRDAADHVKVLDFGIAKILDADAASLTRNDVVCGTPQYMAPEQATGGTLDARCDLYAVGVILYQMVTGHLPFDGQNSMEVLTKHVNDAPVPPRARNPQAPISEGMERLILRAMSKSAEDRPQTAEEFRQELLALGGLISLPEMSTVPAGAKRGPSGLPTELPKTGLTSRPGAWGPRRQLLALGGLLALAAGMGATALWSHRLGLSIEEGRSVSAAIPAPKTAAAGLTAGPGTDASAFPRDAERARALVEEAKGWLHSGDTATARDKLEEAVRFDPQNAEAHWRLAGLYFASQPERARVEFEACRKLDPARYKAEVDRILSRY